MNGSSEEYEIQLNTTIAYIKKDKTVVEQLSFIQKVKTIKIQWRQKNLMNLCLFGETRSHKGIRVMIKNFAGP
nr:hypothetical protein P5659_01420 [Bacillus subtilis]WGD83589.1 hypothetical protein P5664_19070 [Bacillus subtilis]WGE02954.1 hypothetical protein P5651_21640 [Bacillus subtilis]